MEQPERPNGGENSKGGHRNTVTMYPTPIVDRKTKRETQGSGSGLGDRFGNNGVADQTRRITNVPLVPPNPKEFLRATSMRIGRATFAQ